MKRRHIVLIWLAAWAICVIIRSTNLLERLFEENRRRTKVLAHAFGERPMLRLMFAQ